VGNNPINSLDPMGEKILLIGETETDRKAELQAVTAKLSYEARKRVRLDKTSSKYVEITGDLDSFKAMGTIEFQLALLVDYKATLEFGFTNDDLSPWGGAATLEPNEKALKEGVRLINPSSNHRILINQKQQSDIAATRLGSRFYGRTEFEWGCDIQPLTLEITLWHELGHGYGMLLGNKGSQSDSDALSWENLMRERIYGRLGKKNARRVSHGPRLH
jgi:hypothetical protein